MTRYIIVAFKHDLENSVLYKKCNDLNELIENLRVAINEKKANVISIRIVG